MATTLKVPAIDYTSRDHQSIVADIIRAIPFYCPEWTDHNDTDPGIALAKSFAGTLDVLHFYIDRAAGEMYLPTLVKRESIVKIGKLVGFELRSVTPASADVVFTLPGPLASDLTIPKGFKVQTVASSQQTPITYETSQNLVIPAGETEGTMTVVEGVSGTETLGTSNGQAFQKIAVEASIIIESSFVFEVDEGSGFLAWERVESFVNSGPTDIHFRAELDAEELITVFLGDNLQGKIPVNGADFRTQFRKITGDRGGVFGNVGADTITLALDQVFFLGNPVNLTVTNPAQASGGEDVQSIEEAKRLLPASIRALMRAVTPEDYKTLAEQFGGVAKSKVTQGSGGSDPCCACNLDLYVAPTGGGVLSTSAKQDLLNYFDSRKMAGTCLKIKDPTYVGITIRGNVTVFSNIDLKTVQDAVTAAASSFFDLGGVNADFGRDLFLGNLFAAFSAVNGIDHVDIVQCSRVPVPSLDVWSGDGTINTPTVGPAAKDETWTLTFLSPMTFSVVGSESGIQPNGTIGVDYGTPNGAVAFKITAGANPQVLGDRVTFKTSTFLGNVPMDNFEIMAQGGVSFQFVVVPTRLSGVNC